VVGRYFPMKDAPEIGASIEDYETPGRVLTRLPSETPRRDIVRVYDNIGHSLPRVNDPQKVAKRRRMEAARESDPQKKEELLKSAEEWAAAKPFWHRTTANGKPVFASKREVEQFQAMTGHRIGWDQG
jgi:hypothetical protein